MNEDGTDSHKDRERRAKNMTQEKRSAKRGLSKKKRHTVIRKAHQDQGFDAKLVEIKAALLDLETKYEEVEHAMGIDQIKLVERFRNELLPVILDMGEYFQKAFDQIKKQTGGATDWYFDLETTGSPSGAQFAMSESDRMPNLYRQCFKNKDRILEMADRQVATGVADQAVTSIHGLQRWLNLTSTQKRRTQSTALEQDLELRDTLSRTEVDPKGPPVLWSAKIFQTRKDGDRYIEVTTPSINKAIEMDIPVGQEYVAVAVAAFNSLDDKEREEFYEQTQTCSINERNAESTAEWEGRRDRTSQLAVHEDPQSYVYDDLTADRHHERLRDQIALAHDEAVADEQEEIQRDLAKD